MGYFYAIGGANYDKRESLKIDLDIIKETKKESPVVLLIAIASYDNDKKIEQFKSYYESLNAKVVVLYTADMDNTKEEILFQMKYADVIYFTGGITSKLVKFITVYKLRDDLIELCKAGKIIAGVSAGAIMMFTRGFGDKDAYTYNLETVNHQFVDGNNIFDGVFCPHYQKDGLLVFNDEVKQYSLNGYALENGCALKINQDGYYVIKSKGCNAFRFLLENNHQLEYLKEDVLYSELKLK